MLTIHAPSRKPCVIITEIHHYITIIYLRLLQRPRPERLETLDVFSEFLFVIGIHIQISTIIPTRMPITIPAIDPLSRVELLAVVAVDEMDVVVATLRSDQTYMNHSKIRRRAIPATVVVTVVGADASTTVAVVAATGVADVSLHCPGWRHVWPALQHVSPQAVCPWLPLQIKVLVVVAANPAAVVGVGS